MYPEEIESRNKDTIAKFIVVGFLAGVANLVADLVTGQFDLLGQVYGILALFVVYALAYRLFICKFTRRLRLVAYCMLLLPLLAAIYIGTFSSPSKPTFTFAVLLCIASAFVFDRPWRALLCIFGVCVVYGLCCYLAKDHAAFMYDMSHLFIYAPLSMGVALFVIDVRIRDVEQTMMLMRKSEHDALTDAYNRNGGNPRIKSMLASGAAGALMFIDIDDFKLMNDRYGHAVGDKVLKSVSDAIAATFTGDCVVMRVGGDEFVVFDPELADERAVMDKVGRMRDRISAAHIALGDGTHARRTTTSTGVALNTSGRNGYEQLLRAADRMLYAVKGSGKDGCRVQKL